MLVYIPQQVSGWLATMPTKKHKQRVIFLLNDLKCFLLDNKVTAQFSRAHTNGNKHARLFCDLEKSVQYVKRRVRKGSCISHRHDPLLLHIFHLHYAVYLLIGDTETLLDIFSTLHLSGSHMPWLANMVKTDQRLVRDIVLFIPSILLHYWETCRQFLLQVLTDSSNVTALFQDCALSYIRKILCHGHGVQPNTTSVFVSIRNRELTAQRMKTVHRFSPTQLTRWQGHNRWRQHQFWREQS